MLDLLYRQSQLGGSASLARSLLDGLPGSDFSKTMQPLTRSSLLVTGVVTAVDEGQAYVLRGGHDSPVPADSDVIDTLIMNVTFNVQYDVCSQEVPPSTLTLSFPTHSGERADDIKDAFDQLGEVAVFLQPFPRAGITHALTSPVLLSPVDADGAVEWKLAADTMGRSWVKGGTSIQSLQNACQTPSD